MSKVKIGHTQAEDLAKRIKAELVPACSSIEVAGSIRRKKPIIGDIELVCIPMFSADLFGETTPEIALLENHLDKLVRAKRLVRGDKNGANQRLVTARSKGGLLPSHLRVAGGRVWDGDEPVKLGSEQEFLELCGGWVEPEDRN